VPASSLDPTPSVAPHAPTATGPDRSLIVLSVVVIVGMIGAVFDSTIINVALETLGRQLHAPISTIQWVTTGYVLALAIAVPVTGWLSRRLGGKTAWMLALVVFLVGSIAAGFAWDAPSLIVARLVQGAGAGILIPVASNLIVAAAGRERLGSVMATISLPGILGPVLGPVLGGVVVQHLDWRWIFWLNVPLCIAGLLLAWRYLAPVPRDPSARLDGLGLALLSPGVAGAVFGLSRVSAAGGFAHAQVLLPLAVGIVLLAAFALRALRIGGRSLVDLRLLRARSLSVAAVLLFLSGLALFGALLLLPLYLQQVRGDSATTAGLILAAQGAGMLLTRSIAGKLMDRIGPRWIVVTAFLIVAVGTAAFMSAQPDLPLWVILLALVVRGAGLGAATVPLMAVSYLDTDAADVPHASIITRTAQQLGGSFGTAVLAVILESALATAVTTYGTSTTGLAHSYALAFGWATAFAVLSAIIALLLPAHGPRPIETAR